MSNLQRARQTLCLEQLAPAPAAEDRRRQRQRAHRLRRQYALRPAHRNHRQYRRKQIHLRNPHLRPPVQHQRRQKPAGLVDLTAQHRCSRASRLLQQLRRQPRLRLRNPHRPNRVHLTPHRLKHRQPPVVVSIDQQQPARRHARRRPIQPQPKANRPRGIAQVRTRQHNRGIGPRKLHHARHHALRRPPQHLTPCRRRPGEKNLVDPSVAGGINRRLPRRNALIRNRQHTIRQPCLGQHLRYQQRDRRAPAPRLPNHRIPRSQRLHHLHARQQQRIVAHRDDQHPSQRNPLHLTCHSPQP